jgi:hypothetical protein
MEPKYLKLDDRAMTSLVINIHMADLLLSTSYVLTASGGLVGQLQAWRPSRLQLKVYVYVQDEASG